jgi:hypothetical protein
MEYSVRVPLTKLRVLVDRVLDWCELVIAGEAEISGKKLDRAIRTWSRASRYCAISISTFWFEIPTCSSSALSCGSL